MGAAEGEGRQMHIIMVAVPIPGHINPMLHLSYKLASMGIQISFVLSEFNKHKMKLPDQLANDMPYLHNLSFFYIPDGLPPEHGRTTDVVELLVSMDAFYGCGFEELMRSKLVGRHPPVTCVIGNTFIRHVQEVTEKQHGIPYVSFWTQSAASYASVLMVAKGYRPPEGSHPSDYLPMELLPGMPPLKLQEINSFLQCYDQENFMFRLFLNPFLRISHAHSILFNTFEELEHQTLAALRNEHPNILTVGPLLPDSFFSETEEATAAWTAEDERCLSWLDTREEDSVLYVSFGSLARMSGEQIEEIAAGLEASGQAFLWVVRAGLKMGDGETGFVPPPLPEGFLQMTEGRGRVVSWAPQLQVLRHKAVGGFLTHCGWNSTLEGISAGVPLLGGCSSFSDQTMNCRCVVDGWKVGLKLERAAVVERREVAEKVAELMQGAKGKAVRAEVWRWRAAAVKAVDKNGSSALAL